MILRQHGPQSQSSRVQMHPCKWLAADGYGNTITLSGGTTGHATLDLYIRPVILLICDQVSSCGCTLRLLYRHLQTIPNDRFYNFTEGYLSAKKKKKEKKKI